MTNKEAIVWLKETKKYYGEYHEKADDALDIAIKALKERDELIERAYGHVVGQGTKGVIRPDDLQGWVYEE